MRDWREKEVPVVKRWSEDTGVTEGEDVASEGPRWLYGSEATCHLVGDGRDYWTTRCRTEWKNTGCGSVGVYLTYRVDRGGSRWFFLFCFQFWTRPSKVSVPSVYVTTKVDNLPYEKGVDVSAPPVLYPSFHTRRGHSSPLHLPGRYTRCLCPGTGRPFPLHSLRYFFLNPFPVLSWFWCWGSDVR